MILNIFYHTVNNNLGLQRIESATLELTCTKVGLNISVVCIK